MVTRDATTTISAGRRTLPGITPESAEIIRFENIKTTRDESPIPIALTAEVVTAKVGQSPSAMMKTGFSVMIPFFRRSIHTFTESFPPLTVLSRCSQSRAPR